MLHPKSPSFINFDLEEESPLHRTEKGSELKQTERSSELKRTE